MQPTLLLPWQEMQHIISTIELELDTSVSYPMNTLYSITEGREGSAF